MIQALSQRGPATVLGSPATASSRTFTGLRTPCFPLSGSVRASQPCPTRLTLSAALCQPLRSARPQLAACATSNGGQDIPWLSEVTSTPARTEGGAATPLQHDAILVLAGGQTETGSGLPVWVERRLDAAIAVQDLCPESPAPVVCLGGGTPHRPAIMSSTGHVVHESTGCADYLMNRGVRAENILKEVSSYDTIGNGYFSLAIHAIPNAWTDIAVITSDFHMPRTRAIFETLYPLGGATLFNDPGRYSLHFYSVTDDGIFADGVVEARVEREMKSLATWMKNAEGWQTLGDFNQWLHHTHLCYAVDRQHEFGLQTEVDKKALESY